MLKLKFEFQYQRNPSQVPSIIAYHLGTCCHRLIDALSRRKIPPSTIEPPDILSISEDREGRSMA